MLGKTARILSVFIFVFSLMAPAAFAADLDFLVIDTGVTAATVPFDTSIKQKLSITNTSDQVHEINFGAYLQETEDELPSWPQPQVLRFAPGQTLYIQTLLDESLGEPTIEWRFEDRESGETRTEIVTHTITVLDPEHITGDLQLSGTVIDRDGSPVDDAAVVLSTGGWSTQTRTAADGTFVFPGVPVRDDWFIRVERVTEMGFVYVDPAVPSYLVELMPATHTATFSLADAISSPIGYWKGAVDAFARSILLINGVGILDDSDTSAAKLELYTLDGVLQWAYDMGHGGWGADLSRDGAYAAFTTSNPTRTFGVLDGTTGEPIWVKEAAEYGEIESTEVQISSANTYLAIGNDAEGEVILVDLLTGDEVWRAAVFGSVKRVVFSGDDTYLYVGTVDGRVYKLKTSDGSVVWSAAIGSQPNGFVVSADGRYVGIANHTGEVTLLDAETGLQIWQTDVQGEAHWLDFSPDGKYVFVGGNGQHANTLYDTQNGRPVWTLADSSYHGQFAADGEYLLISGKESLFFVDIYGNTIGSLAVDGGPRFAYLLGDGTHLVAVGGSNGSDALFATGNVASLMDGPDEGGEDATEQDTTVLLVLLGVVVAITLVGMVLFAARKPQTSVQQPTTPTKKVRKQTPRTEEKVNSKWLEKKRTTTTTKKSPRKSTTTKAKEPQSPQ